MPFDRIDQFLRLFLRKAPVTQEGVYEEGQRTAEALAHQVLALVLLNFLLIDQISYHRILVLKYIFVAETPYHRVNGGFLPGKP